ncbi:hypothetical protein MJO28_008355 [Puccinia striiformis f. sp. tritici]|uniref:Uncharacterized protein n=1 Tax=Puccinia striiformis f. sp. tritici TaxID=168172 RepID=A0ACC0EAX9_9BASI|nr:hypothetical protein Pst134EA_015558 [Puccinia striiformis f. sp. tritici]KAH9463475.1 hypothetical protein Pst134EA_015558 [Puccinia striiformis f. sp. tritici]KAI7949534.1 hypothetical protein MJO28_008355 [Puccinia striiformis f. sp. tritici]KAI7952631.1 hypothetical protein MJO29_008262 [Puccinia striiformis f. sp. tritici]
MTALINFFILTILCLIISDENHVVGRPAFKPPGELVKASEEEKPQHLRDHRTDVYNWFPSTVEAVVGGRGTFIDRTPEMDKVLKAFRDGCQDQCQTMIQRLGWENAEKTAQPPFLTAEFYGDPSKAVIIKNDYPWDLPDEVEHWVLWMTMPHISEEVFSPLDGETLPNSSFTTPERIEALLEYMSWAPVYGYCGLPEEAFTYIRLSGFEHPTDNDVWLSSKGQKVTQKEAVQAMKWAGRHINKFVVKKFPSSEFEVVWNRSPLRWRSMQKPEHIHILAIKKKSPSSFVNFNRRINEKVESLLSHTF